MAALSVRLEVEAADADVRARVAFVLVALGLDVIAATDDEAKPTTTGDGVKLRVSELASQCERGECLVVGEGEPQACI